jgi:aminoglycoside phosphotransferase (APT) family kinase protein
MIDKFKDIPNHHLWQSIKPVNKGWSRDKKFHIITDEGDHLLLRMSDQATYSFKKKEYEIINKVSELDFHMSRPLDFGLCHEGVYMLLTWVEGVDLEMILPSLSPLDQYNLGYKAGQILSDIHNLDYEGESFDWYQAFTKKIDKKIQAYESCSLKYDQGHLFIDYIEKSKALLKNRPLSLHHGDYHVGNMIYTPQGQIGIIDFNRYDFGDPYEEFNRIVWDVEVSPYFARGRIDGYFKGQVPIDFFKLLALYISNNTLSSLPWAINYGQKEIETMKHQAKKVLDMYDGFNRVIPKWYDVCGDIL